MKKRHWHHQITREVAFSDVDSMRVVWHGAYVRYLEHVREALCRQCGIGYMDMEDKGILTPIIHLSCDYKSPLRYGDRAIVCIRWKPMLTAKLAFEYEIRLDNDDTVVCTAYTEQVFVDQHDQNLWLKTPKWILDALKHLT